MSTDGVVSFLYTHTPHPPPPASTHHIPSSLPHTPHTPHTHLQDYDWRQYASVDSGDLAHDRSLHSRLTNAPHPIHTLPLPTTTATTHSNSSEMESTLSGSMVGLHDSVSLFVWLAVYQHDDPKACLSLSLYRHSVAGLKGSKMLPGALSWIPWTPGEEQVLWSILISFECFLITPFS